MANRSVSVLLKTITAPYTWGALASPNGGNTQGGWEYWSAEHVAALPLDSIRIRLHPYPLVWGGLRWRTMPPIQVLDVFGIRVLVDGHHRVAAARASGIRTLPADITTLNRALFPPPPELDRLSLHERESLILHVLRACFVIGLGIPGDDIQLDGRGS
jgi:hypothetical protein